MSGPFVLAQPAPPDPLSEIKDALGAVQRQLAALGEKYFRVTGPITTFTRVDDGRALSALARARRVYAARRQRDDVFAEYDLFGEPCWDILIDLFIAGEWRKLISVASACIGASCPPTTALRWLSMLHELGLIVRTGDPDMRAAFISRFC